MHLKNDADTVDLSGIIANYAFDVVLVPHSTSLQAIKFIMGGV